MDRVEKPITIAQFIRAINRLPSDDPKEVPGIWYTTQKQHWLGWLGDYDGPGAYVRKNWNRDARFAYNHVVCPGLLLYLIRAIPLKPDFIAAAEEAERGGQTLMAKAGAIRKVVPWDMIYQAIWGHEKESFLERLVIPKGKSREKLEG